jgi:hypothetical protein
METKTYQIDNFQDIFNAITLENLDRFMTDFYKIFHYMAEYKEVAPEEVVKASKMEGFQWIDDGENNIDFNINGKLLSEKENPA